MENFLSKEEYINLRKKHKKELNKRLADRIKTILLLNDCWSYEKISQALLLDETTIRRFEKEYLRGGVNSLLSLEYRGSDPNLSRVQLDELSIYLENRIHVSSKQICFYVKQKYGKKYTQSGMTKLLGRLGFVYKKPKVVPGKINISEQLQFIEKYKNLKKNLGPKEKIYFMDAAHPQHNVKSTYGWIKRGKNKTIPSNTGRRRININALINIDDKKVIEDEVKTVNAETVIKFFKKVEQKNIDCEKIYVICDNARYYRNKNVTQFISSSKIELIFLPPYCPNLNLIERLWKFCYEKVLYNKYYDKFSDFKNAIMGFFENIHDFKEELDKRLVEKFQIVS
ncbi:MAG: IS630 family transposase [Parachlamydiales bacterium]|nr:IS630 family transposase [Parachlamydiales bacterium]